MEITEYGFIVVDAAFGNDFTAKRDSTSNRFKTLRAAFPQIRSNDTVLVYPGVYNENPVDSDNAWTTVWCGAALGIVSKSFVKFQGIGRPEIHYTCHGNGMIWVSCTNCQFTGFKISGMGYMRKGPGRYFALLLFHGVNQGHQIFDNDGMDSGDHIIAHLMGPRTIFDTKVFNNRFYRCGHMIPGSPWPDGVAVGLGGHGNSVTDNYFEECNRCVEVESGTFPNDINQAVRISITGNKIYHPWAHPILITPLNPPLVYGQTIISQNIIQGWGKDPQPDFGPPYGPGSHWAPMGIWITGNQGAIVTENIITDLWDACAIQVESAGSSVQHLMIANNLLQRIGRTGISLTIPTSQGNAPSLPLQFNQVHHNEISDCQGRAIWIRGNYNTIESNIILNSDYAGLYEDGGTGNRFRNNRLFDCGGAAVAGHAPDRPIEVQDGAYALAYNEVNFVKKVPIS